MPIQKAGWLCKTSSTKHKATMLLEDMLALASADSLPVALPRTQVILKDLLTEVCNKAQPLVEQHGLHLVTRLPPFDAKGFGKACALTRLL